MAHHMAAQPGSRIGAYEILGLLGAGGMGEVYRARDTTLQRDVAIEIIFDAFACLRQAIKQFAEAIEVRFGESFRLACQS